MLKEKFYLKFSKSQSCQKSLEYLGHAISNQGVAPDKSKLDAILKWPVPTTRTQLRGFLGLTGSYRRFIENYASTTFYLTELLKKYSFNWHPKAQEAFDLLKQIMIGAPVLKLPDFSKSLLIQTDASGFRMGAVLLQNGHHITYFSKKFCSKLQNSSTYVRELHAIALAVHKWRHYLLGQQFVIETDQKGIRELVDQIVQTSN